MMRQKEGQVMILTIIALAGAILSATTIAGLLMLYQIRQSTDLANSTKAVYAADAGLEWALYNWNCEAAGLSPCPAGNWNNKTLVLSNGSKAVLSITCSDVSGNTLSNCNASNASSTTFKSVGSSGNSSRAFGLSF